MAGVRVHVVMPVELVERVDAVVGDGSRGEFVRRAVERELVRAESEGSALVAARAIAERPEGFSEAAVATARGAVERASSDAEEPLLSSGPTRGSVSSSEGVRSAAPAEQPGRPEDVERALGDVGTGGSLPASAAPPSSTSPAPAEQPRREGPDVLAFRRATQR